MEALIHAAEALKNAVTRCAGAINKESSNPISQTMFLEARTDRQGAGSLRLIVHDHKSHQLQLSVEADINQIGAVIIPNGYFNKVVNKIPKEQFLRLDANREQGTLYVQAGQEKDEHWIALYEAQVDDFERQEDLPPVIATVDGAQLSVAIKECLTSVEKDDEIIFVGREDRLHFYTHNGEWSVCCHIAISSPEQVEDWIASSIVGIMRHLPNWVGPVEIRKDDRVLAFSHGDEHLILRQVTMGGEYAHIEEYLNKQPEGYMIVNQRSFKDKLSYLKDAKTKDAVMLHPRAKHLEIKRTESGKGRLDLKLPMQDKYASTPLICFDPSVLANAVDSMTGVTDLRAEFISFDLGDGEANHLLRLVDDKLPYYRQIVVLPMTDAPED